jgi:hypothetical protein
MCRDPLSLQHVEIAPRCALMRQHCRHPARLVFFMMVIAYWAAGSLHDRLTDRLSLPDQLRYDLATL